MTHFNYAIIGGGMTAASAVKGIREIDTEGAIGLFSAEPSPPYDRPPLSKGLWKGKPVEKIWRKTDEQPNVTLHTSCKITSVDAANRSLRDAEGKAYTYDKLLIATGGKPRTLPFGGDSIIYYRTYRDYQHLRELTGSKQRFAVIGGGFIGSEIAAALTMIGKQVVMAFPENGIGANVYPADVSEHLVSYYRDKGVEVHPRQMVADVQSDGAQIVLKSKEGAEFRADAVIAGIGIKPNIGLAEEAGLEIDNGIIVDEYLRTSNANIFAAGDVAEFYNPTLDKRMRVEHEDNANTMGKFAGRNMAGAGERYDYLPMFYSDLFDLGYEAVGELNSELEVFADWQEKYQKGVLYYLKDGRVRGVLLWNVWDQVENARKLIAEKGPFTDANLQGRLPA